MQLPHHIFNIELELIRWLFIDLKKLENGFGFQLYNCFSYWTHLETVRPTSASYASRKICSASESCHQTMVSQHWSTSKQGCSNDPEGLADVDSCCLMLFLEANKNTAAFCCCLAVCLMFVDVFCSCVFDDVVVFWSETSAWTSHFWGPHLASDYTCLTEGKWSSKCDPNGSNSKALLGSFGVLEWWWIMCA